MTTFRVAGSLGIRLIMEGLQNRNSKNSGKVFSTEELFGKEKEIRIKHRDQVYRLLITKQDKLILNK